LRISFADGLNWQRYSCFGLNAFNPTMKLNPVPFFLLTAALLMNSPTQAEPLTANDADNGRTIELNVGQSLVLTLGANPTTGYSWVFDDQSSQIVVREGKPTYNADTPGKGLVGGGGVEQWTFRAVKPGTETLRLDYRRPWEQADAPASRVEFPVIVK
jgi:inhibitor of cysteine peptidase